MDDVREDKKQWKIALYIRLSREDNDKDESNSITHQREILRSYVKGHPEFWIYDEYIDDGYSGTNFKRPGFERMLSDIRNRKVECVLVKDLSRFARDYVMAGLYIERYFPQWEIRFISLGENYDSIKSDCTGQDLLLPIQNLFNEFHARDTSKKVQKVIHQMQKDGKYVAAFAPYGYRKNPADKHCLLPDSYAAEIVRRIFKMYLDGMGMQTISKALNKEGIKNPTAYKNASGSKYVNHNRIVQTSYWTETTIKRILSNEVYTGTMVQGRSIRSMNRKPKRISPEEWIRIPDTHEAIVDKDTFQKAQLLLKRNTRSMKADAPRALFAGFLKCGECGRSLIKTEWHGNITYRCGTYKRIGRDFCSPHAIKESLLAELLLKDLNVIIGRESNLAKIIEQEKPEPIKSNLGQGEQKIKAELDKCIRKKAEAYDDYKEGVLSKAEFMAYGEACDNRKQQLKLQLQMIRDEKNRREESTANDWIKRLLQSGEIKVLDRDILLDTVDTIYVHENRTIRIVYRFSDESDRLFEKAMVVIN